MGHLRESRFSKIISKINDDGFVEASMFLLAFFFTAFSVMLYVDSLGQAVILLFFEVVFEAAAIPAGIAVFTKRNDLQRKITLLIKAGWEMIVLLIIAVLLPIAAQNDWSLRTVCVYLVFFTFWALAWEAMDQHEAR